MGGSPLSFESYADSIFQRERTLDMCRIRIRQLNQGQLNKRVETVVEGDLALAWRSLEWCAQCFGVPFLIGNWDRSNRLPELEHQLACDPEARARFRSAYATAIVRHLTQTSGHLPLSVAGQQKAAELERDEVYMSNPFQSIVQRIPGLIERLEQRPVVARHAVTQVLGGRSD